MLPNKLLNLLDYFQCICKQFLETKAFFKQFDFCNKYNY